MQQVNFYIKDLRPQTDWLSAKYLSVALLGVFLILVLMHFIKVREVDQLRSTLEDRQLALKALELDLDKVKTLKRPSSKVEIENSIVTLQRKIDSRKRLIELIQGQALDKSFSFFSAMNAMAVHASSRLSLNRFTYSYGGKLVEMQGEAISSSDVPAYMNRLRKDPVFKESDFGLIYIGNIKTPGGVDFSMGYKGESPFNLDVDEK